jgi:hypothetical protein
LCNLASIGIWSILGRRLPFKSGRPVPFINKIDCRDKVDVLLKVGLIIIMILIYNLYEQLLLMIGFTTQDRTIYQSKIYLRH